MPTKEYYAANKSRISERASIRRAIRNPNKKVFVYNNRYFFKKKDLAKYTGYCYTWFIQHYKNNLPLNGIYVETISIKEFCIRTGYK